MKNTIIIGLIIISFAYMINMLFDRYENIKNSNIELNSRNK